MANHRISSRRIRGQLTYTVAEAAQITGSHRNTIRHWLRSGLSVLDGRQPTLIKGATLKAFIDARHANRRQPCGPGRMYCLKCRTPRIPAFGEVEYEPRSEKRGRLIGLCPDCSTLLQRRTTAGKIREAAGNLVIRFRCEAERLDETSACNLNCASQQDESPDGEIQCRQRAR
jgi:hypothetical protein